MQKHLLSIFFLTLKSSFLSEEANFTFHSPSLNLPLMQLEAAEAEERRARSLLQDLKGQLEETKKDLHAQLREAQGEVRAITSFQERPGSVAHRSAMYSLCSDRIV